MNKLISVVYAVCVLGAASLSAQTKVPSPPPAATKLGWTHDGANVTSWRVTVDGVEQAILPTRSTGTDEWAIPFPALTPGTHTLLVGACADIPNFPALCGWSAPFGVVLVVAPTGPTSIRVIPPGVD